MIYIGPAGWSYADWAGIVYPKPRKRGFSELVFLSRYFNTIEINTTFYHPIAPAMAQAWVQKIGSREFQFTAKLWQRFTHDETPFEPGDVRVFQSGIEPLRRAKMLGAVLVQFPWSFKRTAESESRIRRIREAFADFRLVVEVRHISWDDPGALKFLSGLDLGFCNIDAPRMKSSLHETSHVTSNVGYIRFHGRNAQAWFDPKAGVAERYNYLYTPQELGPWVDRIREMRSKTEDVFIVGNNHFQGKGVVNALQLQSMLTGKKIEAPGGLVQRYPDLTEFVQGPKQGDLFERG